MDHQDWKTISWDKRGEKSKDMSNKIFINNQMRDGKLVSQLKTVSANHNKMNLVTNATKLDKEEECFVHTTIGMETGKLIAQARCEKKKTQKEMANELALPLQTIKTFENGKAIYNAMVFNKIEKYLGKRIVDRAKYK